MARSPSLEHAISEQLAGVPSSVKWSSPYLINGLLQSKEYTAAIMKDSNLVSDEEGARYAEQRSKILQGMIGHTAIFAATRESALHRMSMVGDSRVMHDAVSRLVDLTDPNNGYPDSQLQFRIVPAGKLHDLGEYTIHEHPDISVPDVYVDGASVRLDPVENEVVQSHILAVQERVEAETSFDETQVILSNYQAYWADRL